MLRAYYNSPALRPDPVLELRVLTTEISKGRREAPIEKQFIQNMRAFWNNCIWSVSLEQGFGIQKL